jgi:hypothetical protein
MLLFFPIDFRSDGKKIKYIFQANYLLPQGGEGIICNTGLVKYGITVGHRNGCVRKPHTFDFDPKEVDKQKAHTLSVIVQQNTTNF